MRLTGKYTVGEVEERTGVAASSLRQWERRYMFPTPERSASGYRYYSDSDIALIKRMRDLVADGVPPSRAAVMVREPPTLEAGIRAAHELSSELADSLCALDTERAERVLTEAIALYPLDAVLLDVIRPAMVLVGDRWHAGTISVTTEHFASNYVQGRLRGLLRMMPSAARSHRVVVSCGPGERHEIGALILAILLRRAGFDVIYLGADTPIVDLLELVRARGPEAVLLSVTARQSIGRLRAERSLLSSVSSLLILGGEAVAAEPQLAAELGAVFLGNDLRQVVPALDALLSKGPRSVPALEPPIR